MKLADITPVILTLDEEPNIGRTLESIRWAGDIIIVDSGSHDATPSIAAANHAVRFFERAFDAHATQWDFAIRDTAIRTEWILALDADYVVTDELVREMEALEPSGEVNGFRAPFVYCIHGRSLRGSLYPPVTVLYRRKYARYVQDGHTQRVIVDGRIELLHSPLRHDDRKSFRRWLHSQSKYMRIEAEKLRNAASDTLRWQDRVRLLRVVAPLGVFVYLLFFRGLILDGWPGCYYAFQRAVAEAMLSLYLIERDIGLGAESR